MPPHVQYVPSPAWRSHLDPGGEIFCDKIDEGKCRERAPPPQFSCTSLKVADGTVPTTFCVLKEHKGHIEVQVGSAEDCSQTTLARERYPGTARRSSSLRSSVLPTIAEHFSGESAALKSVSSSWSHAFGKFLDRVSVGGVSLADAIHEKSDRKSAIEQFWDPSGKHEPPNIFRELHLQFKRDGGLNGQDLGSLWTGNEVLGIPLSRWRALQVLASIVFNTLFLIIVDMGSLLGKPPKSDVFLVTGSTFRMMGDVVSGHRAFMVVELLLLVSLVSRTLLCLAMILFSTGWKRWDSVASLFLRYVPQLTSFSALKLLVFVNPNFAAYQGSAEYKKLRERLDNGQALRGWAHFIWFVGSRVFFLIVGLDAFLVKFRVAQEYINQTDLTLVNVGGSLMFVFQVLGVTNLGRFSRLRLEIFVFGGEDGVITGTESGIESYWYAELSRRLWNRFNRVQFCAIMLTFSDFDLQRLMLDDDRSRLSVMAQTATCRSSTRSITSTGSGVFGEETELP